MKIYADKAHSLFLSGYNCTQSVVGAFEEVTGLPKELAMRLASPFGGGMGRLREVCGTFSGMVLVLGCLTGYDRAGDYDSKKELYARVQELEKRFREKNNTIICRELLGLSGTKFSSVPEKRTDEYYKKRPCPDLAAFAADILSDYLNEIGII